MKKKFLISGIKANTFGELMRGIREILGLTVAEVAAKLNEPKLYISELEGDKVYPPMGMRLYRMLEVYSNGDEIDDNVFLEMANMQQTKVLSPMKKHIAANWYTRYLLTLLMQLDIDPARSTEEGEIGIRIRKELFDFAEKNGIELKPCMAMFVGDEDEE
ncbi:hypothetical protein EOM82_09055 [bacterium]|nr:hypothetical protein [bacterium]